MQLRKDLLDLFFISHLKIVRELKILILTAQNPSLFFGRQIKLDYEERKLPVFQQFCIYQSTYTAHWEKKSIIIRILQFFINLIMAKFFFFQIQFSIMKRNLLTFRQKDSKKYLSLFPLNYYHIFSLLVPSYVLSCLSLSKRKKYWNKSNRITLPYLQKVIFCRSSFCICTLD